MLAVYAYYILGSHTKQRMVYQHRLKLEAGADGWQVQCILG